MKKIKEIKKLREIIITLSGSVKTSVKASIMSLFILHFGCANFVNSSSKLTLQAVNDSAYFDKLGKKKKSSRMILPSEKQMGDLDMGLNN